MTTLRPQGRCQRWLPVAWACSVGVLGTALLPGAPLARAAAPGGTPGPVPAGSAVARLTVSNVSPRQGVGVLFDASTSTSSGPFVIYYFDYGDGTSAVTYQPLAMHAYRRIGVYNARVVITDTLAQTAASVPLRLVVRDGVPPTVSISFPRPNIRVHFGRRGPVFSGGARDASGVRRVELAMSLLSVSRARGHRAAARCFWYDGRRALRARSCGSPLFFRTPFSRGRWRFRVNARARIPAGIYSLRARALDTAGNLNSIFSPRLRTIVGFDLVP